MCTILGVFQEAGPMEKYKYTLFLRSELNVFDMHYLCRVFALLSTGPCLVFIQQAFPFLDL